MYICMYIRGTGYHMINLFVACNWNRRWQTFQSVLHCRSLPKKKVHLETYYYYDASFTKLSSQSSATSRCAYSTKPSFQSVLQGLKCNHCNKSGWMAGLSSKPEPEMETAKLSVEFSMYIFLVAEISIFILYSATFSMSMLYIGPIRTSYGW